MMILLRGAPDSFDNARSCRRIGLSEEAALYFCHEGCRMLFCLKGAVHISVDSDDPTRSRHLELEICVVRHRIESCKCGLPEQCVVATAERDDVED